MARNGMKTGRDYKNVERFHLLDYDTFVFQLCHTFHLRSTLLSPTKPKKKKKPSITPGFSSLFDYNRLGSVSSPF
jgi:hypothetical protein